jgi:hypothetical protein
MAKPEKHVVVLGAGASITSGYPDANRLTTLMCDRQAFFDEFISRATAEGEQNAKDWARQGPIRQYYDSFNQTVRLLRSGDFATMDELSNLATGGQHASEILKLKTLMRFVFALANPELSHWPKSDYRSFIHALFQGKSQIREDISVISFNYDPYFEFRLLRALRARTQVRPISDDYVKTMSQAATSGFLFPENLDWLEAPGFCHLKLHGTCALPIRETQQLNWPPQQGESIELTSARMFAFETLPRLATLSNPSFSTQEPPVLLPWEIVSNDGQLLKKEEFEAQVGNNWQHTNLYPLFRGIWQRARNDIQRADKISFIGLSIASFMQPELHYLFAGKRDTTQIVVANPENQRYATWSDPFHSRTLCGKVLDTLSQICPNMACNRSDCEIGEAVPRPAPGYYDTLRSAGRVTARTDFAEFIKTEL